MFVCSRRAPHGPVATPPCRSCRARGSHVPAWRGGIPARRGCPPDLVADGRTFGCGLEARPPIFPMPSSDLLELDDPIDRRRQPPPFVGFLLEPPPTCSGQRVELGAPAQFTRLPLRDDPARQLEFVERRVQRAIADLESVAGDL